MTQSQRAMLNEGPWKILAFCNVGGTCEVCGQALSVSHVKLSNDAKVIIVGNDCAIRIAGGNGTAAQKATAAKNLRKEIARKKRMQQNEWRYAAREENWKRQCDSNKELAEVFGEAKLLLEELTEEQEKMCYIQINRLRYEVFLDVLNQELIYKYLRELKHALNR